MIRSLVAMLIVGVTAGSAIGQQQVGGTTPQQNAAVPQGDAWFPDKTELLRRIALYEAAERSAEAAHAGTESMVKIYATLAVLYEDASMYSRSEEVMRREIAMLRSGPQEPLAEAMGHLAVVHIGMGKMREAEKDATVALRIREGLGDPVGIAKAWSDLADIYIKQGHYKPAFDYAQKAMAVLADNPKVEVVDRVVVRQTLAHALCGLKQCAQAIPILKAALELEKSRYGEDSLMVGSGYFLLGHAAWKAGDMQNAAAWMLRGTTRMKVDLGWGHVIYLNAMTEYARFLRERGQTEAAASAEREVKMANAVVDARSLAKSPSAFAGSR